MNTPTYQYHVLTWGGFYNEEYKKIHGLDGGDFFFDTSDERDNFVASRKSIEKKLGANVLCFSLSEGFCCDVRTVLHRVVEFGGKQYYTFYDIGVNHPFSAAIYHLENKWYPGFNDYPLGEDFDYTEVTIVKEWITGAFQDFKDL